MRKKNQRHTIIVKRKTNDTEKWEKFKETLNEYQFPQNPQKKSGWNDTLRRGYRRPRPKRVQVTLGV